MLCWPKSAGYNGWSEMLGPETKTEMVTKMVPVRAVNFSIGAFCTEFRCEQLCDDDIFPKKFESLVEI